jgi:hypothetical protein
MNKQCPHEVLIGLTDLTYLCVKGAGHDGPHQIAISSDFEVLDPKHDAGGFNGLEQKDYAAIYRNIWGLYDSNAAPQAVTGSAPQSDGSGDYGLTGSGPAVAAPKGGMAMLMDTDGPRMQGVIRALRQWIGFQSNDNAAELHRQAVLLFGLDIIHGDHDDE